MNHPAIEEAILRIYSNCDGAQTRDNVGFDGSDAKRGAKWAQEIQIGLPLTAEDQSTVLSILHKYHRQLGDLKIPPREEIESYLNANRDAINQARANRLAEIEQEKNKKYFETAAKYQAKSQEFPQTHPDVFTGLMTLRELGEANDFIYSLCSRLDGGRDLTDKQQLAGRKFIHWISLTENELKAWLGKFTTAVTIKSVGSISLSKKGIVVDFEFSRDRLEKVRSVLKEFDIPAGQCWDAGSKVWNLPLETAQRISEILPELEVKTGVMEAYNDKLADSQADTILAAQRIEKLIAASDLDNPFNGSWTLRNYQKQVVAESIKIIETGVARGPIVAMPMGSGKTLMALFIAKAYQQVYGDKVFVVCPASLKDNWKIEAGYVGIDVEVFSWAKQPEPLDYNDYILIGDESHYIQSGTKSKRGKQFLELSRHPNCRAIIPMTGTPMKNGKPINLLPILETIDHKVAKNNKEYQKKYCNAGLKPITRKQKVNGRIEYVTRQVWDNQGASHLDELREKIGDVLLMKKKEEILPELPPKTQIFIPVELSAKRQKEWKASVAEAQINYEKALKQEEETGKESGAKLVLLTKLRAANSLIKADAAIAYAEEIMEQGGPVVLFTEFLPAAHELYIQLSQKYNCELLTGETKNEDRQPMVERFQSGESDIFISTIKAGGVGITLTRASDLLLVDRSWTPGDNNQASDRIHRIGSVNPVTIAWLQHSQIDEWVDALLTKKEEIIEKVFSGKRKTLRGAKSPNDIVDELLKVVLG